MTTAEKKPDLPEESIPIRVICCLLAIIAISCSFIFGKSPVPVVEFSPSDIALFTAAVWMCIGGCMFSYHYRECLPRFMEVVLKVAATAIVVNLARELWMDNLHSQQFQCLYPLVDTLTATSVVSCFELRTRRDILATSTFGLSLMALAGFSGRSIVFGACVFLYIVLGALLLCLTARSYAATLPGADTRLATTTTGGRFIPALVLSCLLLPCLSIAAFSFMPRLDSTADSLSIQLRSAVTTFMYQHAVRHSEGTSLPEVDPNAKARHRPPKTEEPEKEKPKPKPKPKPKSEDAAKPVRSQSPSPHPAKPATPPPLPAPKPATQPPKSPPPPRVSGASSGKARPPGSKHQMGGGTARSAHAMPRLNNGKTPHISVPSAGAPTSAKTKTPPAVGRVPPASKAQSAPPILPPIAQQPARPPHPVGPGGNGRMAANKAFNHKGMDGKSKSDMQGAKAGKTDKPAAKAGKADKPGTKAGKADKPGTKAGKADKPGTKAGKADKPGTKAGKADKPGTKAGKADKPAAKAGKAVGKGAGTTVGKTPPRPTPQMVPMPHGTKVPFFEPDSSVSVDKPLLPTNEILFTLACNRQMYVRLGYYDDFDGRTWRRRDVTNSLAFAPSASGVNLSSCPTLQIYPAMPMVELTENFKIINEIGTSVPAAGVPRQLSLWETVNVDAYGNVTVAEPLQPGTSYTAICQCPVYSLQQLRQTHSFADGSDSYVFPYLTLPANQSDQTINLSSELCKGGFNRFVEAENVVAYLRKNYKYTLQPVQAAANENLVDQFLFHARSGDCKAFASSFIVLCRAAGIPARFVSGFMPGDVDPLTGAACVKRKHGHAWAEIYMEPYGWIAFDPTPGGLLPARPDQKYYNYTEVKRAVTQWHGRLFVQGLETALRYSGYGLALLAAGLGLTAAIMSAGVLRRLWKTIGASLRHRHPAMKVRERVLARLGKIGVQPQLADTGKDVVSRLEAILSENPSPTLEDQENLKRSVSEFFETYNAIVYGNEKEMERLKAIAMSIEYQSRARK